MPDIFENYPARNIEVRVYLLRAFQVGEEREDECELGEREEEKEKEEEEGGEGGGGRTRRRKVNYSKI